MQIVEQNPKLTMRGVALKVGISNGSAYYLLTSLIDKGYIKLLNFKENSQKMRYIYLLTPKGIHEKSLRTHNFINRKKRNINY
jgi:EPS-associated MarR family transcriptional regulator